MGRITDTQLERISAKERGDIFYFTDRQCRRGHDCARYVSTGSCVKCACLKTSEWRISNPEKRRAQGKAYFRKYPDKVKAKDRSWNARNRERKNATNVAWRKRNPEKTRLMNARNNSRRRGVEGTFSADNILIILKLQNGRCADPTCKKPLYRNYHIDHIKPISRGGTNYPSNLQLLCPLCNRKKWRFDPIDYARLQGFLI